MKTYTLGLAMAVLLATGAWAAAQEATEGVQPGDDPSLDLRVLLLKEGDKTPTDFTGRNGPEGVIRAIDEFRKGVPKGHTAKIVVRRFYNANYGKFDHYASEFIPLNPKGKEDGKALFYSPGEGLGGLERTVEYKDGVAHGQEIVYERGPDHKTYERKFVPHEKGEIHGIVRMHYYDGKLMSETPYVKGKQHGDAKSYTEDGFVYRVTQYKDGQCEGTRTEWWKRTKKLKAVIEYKSGKAHGTAKEYFETGGLKMEAKLWEDKFHGERKVYDETGKLRETYYFILDEQVSPEEFKQRYKVPPDPPVEAKK